MELVPSKTLTKGIPSHLGLLELITNPKSLFKKFIINPCFLTLIRLVGLNQQIRRLLIASEQAGVYLIYAQERARCRASPRDLP